MTSTTLENEVRPLEEPLVPVELARTLLGAAGRPIARQTVLSLGVRREIDVRMVAGRFVATAASIDAYRSRHGIR